MSDKVGRVLQPPKPHVWLVVLSAVPAVLAFMFQIGPKAAGKNLCEWMAPVIQTSCPSWLSYNVQKSASLALWTLFLAALFTGFWPRLRRLVSPVPQFKIIHDGTRDHPHWIKRLIAANSALLIAVVVVGIGGYIWLGERAYFGVPYWWFGPIPKEGDIRWPAYIAKKHSKEATKELTIYDLFVLDDDATHGTTFSSTDVLNDPNERPIAVRKSVHLDMDRGSRSLAFYVPYWNDTYGVGRAMLGRVPPVLDLWAEFVVTQKDTGDADVLSSKDVPFSHRVYFYSEKELTAEETGELAKAYRESGLQFLPRSQSFLAATKLKFENEQLAGTE